MAVVRFTATRSLIGGVTLNDVIEYDLPIRWAGMTRQQQVFKSTKRSMGGRRATYAESAESQYSISTKPLTATQSAALVMFLDSVQFGEPFEFAPAYYASQSPISWQDAVIDEGGYDEPRLTENDSLFTYAFRITVLP